MLKHVIVSLSLFTGGAALAQGAAAPKPAAPKAAAPAAAAPAAPAAKDDKAAKQNDKAPAAAKDDKAAKKEAAPAPPAPPAELASLKVYEGKWKCDTNIAEGPMGPAHKVKAKMAVKSDLGGFFYNVRYEEKKAKDHPMPYTAQGFVGYDPAKKVFTRSDVNNMGGVAHFTAAPWAADAQAWTGEAMGMGGKMPMRQTFTKKSARELAFVLEMQGKDGAWVKMSDAVCKK